MKKILILFLLLPLLVFGKERTVFLTGSCGFIGSHFLEHLFDKYPDYRFFVVDALTYAGSLDNIPERIRTSERFAFFHNSVTDFSLMNALMAQADFVVHFAAETHVPRSINDDLAFFETDVLGTRSMLRALVQNRNVERFIHVSTSEVYGTAAYQPMDEKHPLNPRSPYAAAKAAADRLVYAYNCTYDVPAVIVRPFNNYGPRQHPEKMIPRFIHSAMKEDLLAIHGDGLQTRDWTYVGDTCEALDRILHSADFAKIKNQEINLGTGRAVSVREIAELIASHFPSSRLKNVPDRPGQVHDQMADSQKAGELLGWAPTTTLEEGIAQTIQWYVDNPTFAQKRESFAVISIETKEGTIDQ